MKSKRLLILLGCLVAVALVAVLAIGCGGTTTTTTAAQSQSTTSSSVATSSSEAQTTTTAAPAVKDALECPQGPQSADTPQYGGTLVILHQSAPTNIGAFWGTYGFMDSMHARWAVENLVGLNAKGEAVPQLATSWDIDKTAKTVTFHLRQGVKFHDGTDFNADAAKWNLDMFRNGKNMGLKDVTAVDVVDPYTVRLTMTRVDPLFVKSLSASNAGKMVSPTAYKQMGEEAMKLHPVGTGPFMFDSYQPDVSLKFKAFKDYWQKGLPYLDAVEIKFVADPVVALTSYKSGEAQVLFETSAKNTKALESAGSSISTRVLSIYGIGGDSTTPGYPFSNQKVREAIAYAIDNTTIVNGVWGGFCPPTNQLAVENGQGWDPTIVGHPYDKAKAQALLAEAGITPDKPWETTLSYNVGDENTEMFTVIQQSLAELGIKLNIKPLPFPAMRDKSQKGFKNELILFTFSYNGIEMDYSTSMRGNLSKDATAFKEIAKPDDFNALYEQMLSEQDLTKRDVLYQQLNKMAVDKYCMVVPLMCFNNCSAIAPNVHDLGFASKAIEFLPETAWMSK